MSNEIRKNTDLTGINKALARIRGKHEGPLGMDDEFEDDLDYRGSALLSEEYLQGQRTSTAAEVEARLFGNCGSKRGKGVTPGKAEEEGEEKSEKSEEKEGSETR